MDSGASFQLGKLRKLQQQYRHHGWATKKSCLKQLLSELIDLLLCLIYHIIFAK